MILVMIIIIIWVGIIMITSTLAAYRSWGDHRVAQPWHVQWLGNIAAFYLVTCTGLGRYLYRPIAHSYCRGDAGNRQHVVPRAVAALLLLPSCLALLGGLVALMLMHGGVS